MKKGLLVVFAAVIALTAASCTTFNNSSFEGNVYFAYSKVKGKCFAGGIEYHKDESQYIIIPETYEGYTVNQLGGYYGTGVPCPFGVVIDTSEFYPDADGVYSADEAYLYTDFFENETVVVQDMEFHIILPSGLSEIVNVRCDSIHYAEYTDESGKISVKVIRPVYYLEISEDNEFFYTKDGKLYYEATDELVENIVYESYNASK